MIISQINPNKRFYFCPVPHNEILKQIKGLDTERSNTVKRYPDQIVKSKTPISFQFSSIKMSTNCIKNSKFPSDLKLANVTPCYKKKIRKRQ